MMIDDIMDPRAALRVVNRERLAEATVFNVQNVCDYYMLGTDQEDWLLEKHFPCIAPAAPVMWFEYTRPRLSFSKGKMIEADTQGRVGVYVDARPAEEFRTRYFHEKDVEVHLRMQHVRWLLDATVFVRLQGERQIVEIGGYLIPVDVEGRYVALKETGEVMMFPPSGMTVVGPNCYAYPNGEAIEMDLGENINMLHPALLALCFMHCKNVEVVESPPHPPKQQKARTERGARPFVRWRTVVIEPVKKMIAGANQGRERLTPEALHIVRGHFKDFKEHGLFGKYRGRYFWPMHARGDKEAGVVAKDYVVEGPPKE